MKNMSTVEVGTNTEGRNHKLEGLTIRKKVRKTLSCQIMTMTKKAWIHSALHQWFRLLMVGWWSADCLATEHVHPSRTTEHPMAATSRRMHNKTKSWLNTNCIHCHHLSVHLRDVMEPITLLSSFPQALLYTSLPSEQNISQNIPPNAVNSVVIYSRFWRKTF